MSITTDEAIATTMLLRAKAACVLEEVATGKPTLVVRDHLQDIQLLLDRLKKAYHVAPLTAAPA